MVEQLPAAPLQLFVIGLNGLVNNPVHDDLIEFDKNMRTVQRLIGRSAKQK